jgi:bacteriorhodopsin
MKIKLFTIVSFLTFQTNYGQKNVKMTSEYGSKIMKLIV